MNTLAKTLAVFLLTFCTMVPRGMATFDPVGEDIDIFLANPTIAAERPNVLILLDNTANWNTPFTTEKSALVSVVNSLSDAYNVGVMMFPETGSPNDNVDGGYVRFAVRQMTTNNKTALATMVNNLDITGDKGNNATFSLLMYEAYAYFAGISARAGYGKAKRDYAGNTAYNPLAAGLAGNAFTSAASTTYVSPISNGCQKNFIIVISNGPASDNASSLAAAETLLEGIAGASPSTISISPTGEQNNWMDEYAKFMANNDCNANYDGVQSVMTYTVDVDPPTTGQGPSHSALLQSAAVNGKGKYFNVSAASGTSEIVTALNQIFQEIQSVNSVFASTTLPVSVNVRGTNLNQVYIGVFRPDPNKSPRWYGNLKLYNLAVNDATQSLFLADATGTSAENASTGFITNSAKSFWTTASTFWSFRTPYDTNDIGQASDLPDGDLVEKGGAAQRVRVIYPTSTEIPNRKLYTCTGGCAAGSVLSGTPFVTTNSDITAGDLGTYVTKTVTSLTSAATTATATVTAHGFSSGNSVTIAGASPSVYNGDFTISVIDANTFTYTLSEAPSANTGTAVATSHGLNSGDLVTVTGSAEAGYNVTDQSMTKVDVNSFTYTLGASVTGPSTGHSVVGKKLVQALIGAGTTATATLASHGYSSGASITISGAAPSEFNRTATITVTGTDSFTYPLASAPSGFSTTAKATSAGHGFSTGDTITIAGATPSNYNGGYAITVVDSNTFTYTLASAESLTASGTITASKAQSLGVTQITHPTSGAAGDRDVAWVTTASAHGFATSDSVTIAGSGTSNYNGVKTVVACPSVTGMPTGTSVFCFTNGSNNIRNVSPAASTTSGMTVSKAVSRSVSALVPVVSATGSIYAGKTITVTSISTQTSATGAITAGRKSDADTAGRADLINWVRGVDNKSDENSNSSTSDIRASVHGDVLHSRPAVVNYNRNGDDNDVFIFYGANDGMFHGVQGGYASNGGDESWSFVAKEFFSKLKRLRENSPAIGGSNRRDYFFDGPIGVYTLDVNGDGKLVASDGDKVWLFIGMRRGGRYIYALDVSDPAAPKFLWKKGCPNLDNNTGCDTGFDAMGQTWSEPKVTWLKAYSNPVLIFGAGYDPAPEDPQPCLVAADSDTQVQARTGGSVTYTSGGSCTYSGTTTVGYNRTIGRGIYVVDATDGTMLWRAGPDISATKQVADMKYAIPADLTMLNRDRDNSRTLPGRESIPSGYTDRVYAVDTGGNLWRVDLDSATTTSWTVTKLASVSGSDLADKRKFLFAPDVVYTSDANGRYDAVLVGSGDREHPFDATITNRFYMFKDRDVGLSVAATGLPITGADLFDATTNCLQDTSICNSGQQATASANLLASKGWYLTLGAGEKVVGTATTVAGTTFFNTNQPSASAGGGSCGSNLGIAREYLVSFRDATATTDINATGTVTSTDRVSVHAGGGYLPSPVPVIVQLGSKKYQAVISGTSVKNPGGLALETRVRTYWQRKIE